MRILSLFIINAIASSAILFSMPKREDPEYNASMADSSVNSLFYDLLDEQDDIFLSNYSTVYFSSLNENFPVNSHGTCSFVAMSMMISFVDSYWDDSFIDESLEKKSNYNLSDYAGYDEVFDVPSFEAESPGIISEDFDDVIDMSYEQYVDYVKSNADYLLQSHLIEISENITETDVFESLSNPFGLSLYNQTQTLIYYLTYDRSIPGARSFVTSTNTFGWSLSEATSEALDYILDGIPVMMNVQISGIGGHTVVAYDYDDSEGEIYVHSGWKDGLGNALAHVSLSQLDVISIDSFVVLRDYFSYDVDQPKNYISPTGLSRSSYDLAYPNNLRMVNEATLSVPPVFLWDSLYDERWYSECNPYFEFLISDSEGDLIISKNIVSSCMTSLTQNEWSSVLYSDESGAFTVSVSLKSCTYQLLPYIYIKSFSKTTNIPNVVELEPTDHSGYTLGYSTTEGIRNNFTIHSASSTTFKFMTRRFNAGLKSNGNISLSTGNAAGSLAFVEYYFFKPIDKIELQMSIFEDVPIGKKAKAVIQEYRYGEYWDKADLLAISTDESNMSTVSIYFDRPISQIRVFCSLAEDGISFGDCVCLSIGGLSIYENGYSSRQGFIPPCGSELAYNPNLWNNLNVVGWANCYCYVMNRLRDDGTTIDPGFIGNHNQYVYYHLNGTYFLFETIEEMMQSDSTCSEFLENGFVFTNLRNKIQKPSLGAYRISLCFDLIEEDEDYHWYRQNPDGSWSHKPSAGPIRDYDFDGNRIYDPEFCNRRSQSITAKERQGIDLFNYSSQMRFYSVKLL